MVADDDAWARGKVFLARDDFKPHPGRDGHGVLERSRREVLGGPVEADWAEDDGHENAVEGAYHEEEVGN